MALKRRSKISTSFSMSSMTDIVFLLLIFFMITSTMVHPNAIKLLIPKQASKKVIVDEFVNIRVSPVGNYYYNNKRVTQTSLEKAIIDISNSPNKTFIKLRTDRGASTGATAPILDVAESYGVKVVLDIR
nr:biopolymer transporter ExbD [Saccharicrinis aurantiacus]